MALGDLLRQKKSTIVDKWIDKTLGTYPSDAGAFFRKQKNQFANPVGQTLASSLEAIYDILLEGIDAEPLCRHLEEIIKIRNVQEFTPGQALVFVFMLKDVIRDVMSSELEQTSHLVELLAFERQIDQAALFALDLFVKYREKVYELRVNEIKRQVSTLMKRSHFFIDETEPKTDNQKDVP
jgi:hypothetical protein